MKRNRDIRLYKNVYIKEFDYPIDKIIAKIVSGKIPKRIKKEKTVIVFNKDSNGIKKFTIDTNTKELLQLSRKGTNIPTLIEFFSKDKVADKKQIRIKILAILEQLASKGIINWRKKRLVDKKEVR